MRAVFASVDAERLTSPTVHFWATGADEASPMPHPHVVLAVSDGTSAMLYRYAADGTFAGDTWHESLEEAKAAAEEEYGLALQAWREVPADVTDAHAYAIAHASRDG